MKEIANFGVGKVMFELQHDRHPRPILLNRLGCIIVEQGEDSEEAVLYMRGLLNREDKNDRVFAFLFLSALGEKDIKVSNEIKGFCEDPENECILNRVQDISRDYYGCG